MVECLFCKIAKKEVFSSLVYEDDKIVAFPDINPKAPVHLLLIPKKHLTSLNEAKKEDKKLLGHLFYQAKVLAEKKNIAQNGYKLVLNCGKAAGQVVDHLHLHLLGGKPLADIV